METIIVLAILGVAVVATGWPFYKTITGKKDGCSYGDNCKTCNNTGLINLGEE